MNIDTMELTDRIRYIVALEHIGKTNVNVMAKYDNQVHQYVLGLEFTDQNERETGLLELKNNINKTFTYYRNKFSHILHNDKDVPENVLLYTYFHARKIAPTLTEKDIHNNKAFTTKGLLFFISLRSTKATMFKLLDSIENGIYKVEREFYSHYAIRDGYNISRDTGQQDITHWTLYCGIMDYLRKPIQNTNRAEVYAKKRDDSTTKKQDKTEFDIRPLNKYAFDVFCLQYLSLIEDNPVELARSISTYCEKKKKRIKRPYFKDTATEALNALNTYRRTDSDTNEDLKYEDCEIYRNAGDCYIARLQNQPPILIQRRFLEELLALVLSNNNPATTMKQEFEKLYIRLKEIEINKDGKFNTELPKSSRVYKQLSMESYHKRFCSETINKNGKEAQLYFILWFLQKNMAQEEGLNKEEYQCLFEILKETDDIKSTIKEYLDSKNIQTKKLDEYFKNSLKETLCTLCTKLIEEQKESYLIRFNSKTIKDQGHHAQIRFVLWALQRPIAKKEGVDLKLDQAEYQRLLQDLVMTDNVKDTIQNHFNSKNIKIKELGKTYIKNSLSNTVSTLCTEFKKWIKNEDNNYKKFLKIKDEIQPNNPAPKQDKSYIQPNPIVLGKLSEASKEIYKNAISNLYINASKNQGKLIWENYWNEDYSDISKVDGYENIKEKFNKEQLKNHFKNKSTFFTDKVLLALAGDCFNKYKSENKINVTIVKKGSTLNFNTVEIEGVGFDISHLGKPYMQNADLPALIQKAKLKKNADKSKYKAKKTIISYMEQVLSENKRAWYRFGEAILEIEKTVVKNNNLTVPETEIKGYVNFFTILEHLSLSAEDKKKIENIRNICFHIDIKDRNDIISTMTNDDIVALINPIRTGLSLKLLDTDVEIREKAKKRQENFIKNGKNIKKY